MKQLYEKNRIWFAVGWILVYVLIFGNLRSLGDDSPYVMTAMIAMCAALLAFILKNGLAEYYGLDHWGKRIRPMLYYIPLWIVASGNLWGGIAPKYEGAGLFYAIVMFALVGVVEELLLRGFLFRAMCEDGSVVTAIIVSSVTFGMGHIVNLLSGHGGMETLVQVIFAVAIGFLFTLVYYRSESLLPCILAHSIIDVLSVFSARSETMDTIYIVSVFVITAVYGIYLWKLKPEQ
ncbi:MAG: CPBP family intramembrane metalloprotease [Solobacterium sp.]|nr:CPBP family intramembrane metalloprotease [Solobacterium sp.]